MATFKNNNDTDADNGSGGATSSGDGGDALPKDDVQTGNNAPADFVPRTVMARVLSEEEPKQKEEEREANTELSPTEVARRKAAETEARLGISFTGEQKANAELEVISGRQLDANSVQKITGLDQAILAMAVEAGRGARERGVSEMQDFTLATGRNFDEEKRIVGEDQQRQTGAENVPG